MQAADRLPVTGFNRKGAIQKINIKNKYLLKPLILPAGLGRAGLKFGPIGDHWWEAIWRTPPLLSKR